MKVEIGNTWPLPGQFYELARGKSGAASFLILPSQTLKKAMAEDDKEATPSEETKKLLEEVDMAKNDLGDITELRGIILHKTMLLAQTKGCRLSLVEFLLELLNRGVYPKAYQLKLSMI